MYLVEVDVVGLQTAETGLHTVHDVAARSLDVIPPRADEPVGREIAIKRHSGSQTDRGNPAAKHND